LFKPYIILRTPLLTETHIKQRLNFARWWRKNKTNVFRDKPFMFSDEKIFVIDGGLNRQNNRVYALSREQANQNGGNFLNKYLTTCNYLLKNKN
jgi:hypothetical protein